MPSAPREDSAPAHSQRNSERGRTRRPPVPMGTAGLLSAGPAVPRVPRTTRPLPRGARIPGRTHVACRVARPRPSPQTQAQCWAQGPAHPRSSGGMLRARGEGGHLGDGDLEGAVHRNGKEGSVGPWAGQACATGSPAARADAQSTQRGTEAGASKPSAEAPCSQDYSAASVWVASGEARDGLGPEGQQPEAWDSESGLPGRWFYSRSERDGASASNHKYQERSYLPPNARGLSLELHFVPPEFLGSGLRGDLHCAVF